jgi:hypothetical protein
MKRRARRAALGAGAVGSLLLVVLTLANGGVVWSHLEAWRFQLARETKTIAPFVHGAALDRALDPFTGQLLLNIAVHELPHPVVFDPQEASQIPGVGTRWIWLRGEENARVLLERLGYHVLLQRFPRKAYVLIRSGDSLLPSQGVLDPPVRTWEGDLPFRYPGGER